MSKNSDPAEAMPMTGKGDRPEPKPRGENMSMYTNKEPSRSKSRQIRNWKIAAVTFMVISACLLIGIIALAVTGSSDTAPASSVSCTDKSVHQHSDAKPPKECMLEAKPPSGRSKMFDGFTLKEVESIVNYMKSQRNLKLVSSVNASIQTNYIYSIEEYLPNKKDVTDWLDGKRSKQPERKARVILFMGETRQVVDYLVWPIPNPKSKEIAYVNRKRSAELTWKSRPVCSTVEAPALGKFVVEQITNHIEGIYIQSFTDGTCEHIYECIYANYAPRVVYTSSERHIIVWFFVSPSLIEDYYMYALPFYMILSTSDDGSYNIVAVYYNNHKYNSLNALKDDYHKNSQIRYKLPDVNKNRGEYGSPRYLPDGDSIDQKRRPPQQYYPDGPRFSVTGQHIEWLGWQFDIHFRTLTGMQIFDVQYKKERIAYELSMQDVLVLYSGEAPDDFFKNYFDVGWSIGRSNMPLVRGIDCPSNAIYLNSSVYNVGLDGGIVLEDAVCVFEHRNSIPLRHHYSPSFFEWGYRYAFSMPDSVLVVRQIINVWNYDYIFDYEFHQNGVVEVKVASTGYVAVTTNIGHATVDRGMVINPDWNAVANLHQHLFNFKFDLDIAGTKNNFKTVTVESQRQQSDFSVSEPWYQMHTMEKEITKESDAAMLYKFDDPKQYVIYNNDVSVYKDSSQKRGYKIQSNSFSKVMMPPDWPMLKGAASWAKYQLTVTKFDDNERTTASYFTQGDPFDPAVSFDEFRAGDQSLDDVDLVAWTTVGLLHLPTYEDLPVTSTPGKVLSISLVPFNFFKRDPSIHSRDAAVFWNSAYNITDDYFYQNDTCPAVSSKPTLNV